jgi:pimeloyl-ACP methyl ester carboxylesterase
MWKVGAFTDGAWREVPALTIDGVPFSSAALLEHARTASDQNNTKFLDYLSREVEEPDASRDAIELWAAKAAEESRELDWDAPHKVTAVEEAVALSPQTENARVWTLAWHDRTAVIVPFSGNNAAVVVEYTPSPRDELRLERLNARYGGTEYELETVFDWRGYFGNESAIIDHWTTMRRSGRSFVASIVGTSGFAVGTVVRRLRRPQPTFERDPWMRSRLITMLERYPQVEAQCPDLSTTQRATHTRAMVFVHGTVSCGAQGLKDLFPAFDNLGPIYRYEHDTFRPIEENAVELADWIRDRIDTQRLLIVGHSRGGLVARTAAARLANGYPGQVEICTFGTPHRGTPLVAAGGRLLNLLFKLGEDVLDAIPIVSPLSKAYGYLVDSPVLPPGIQAMAEEASGLGTLNAIGDRYPLRSWGSTFDINRQPSGFGVAIEGVLAGALSDRTHDLVVPTASALAAGATQSVLDCSHVHYFAQNAVQQALAAFFTPPAVPAGVPVPAAAAAPGPQIIVADDYVVIAGVRVARRQTPAAGISVFAKPVELKRAAAQKSAG